MSILDSDDNRLHRAVVHGDLKEVRELIELGIDVDLMVDSKTPLILAIENEMFEMAQELIQQGAHVNHCYDESPLHVSASHGLTDLTGLLLASGANPNILAEERITPLMCAAEHGSIKVASQLVKAGADIDAWSQEDSALTISVANGHLDFVKYLLSIGSKHIDMALIASHRHNQTEIEKYLKSRVDSE